MNLFFTGTPFSLRTAQLNQTGRWTSWDRYHLPEVFTDYNSELKALRETAMLEDKSPLTKYYISGPDAQRFLNHLITRDATKIDVNHAYYAPWCDERGKVIVEGLVFRLAEDIYCLTCNPMEEWFAQNKPGYDVQIEDVSNAFGILALQGPKSYDILMAATGQDWSDLRFSRGGKASIGGVEVHLWRQGFTGERGYEFWVPTDGAVKVWDALWEAGKSFGISACGHNTQDVARIEAGLVLPAIDYTRAGNLSRVKSHAYGSQDVHFEASPFELGLGRFVDFSKEAFVGKQALLEEQAAGGASHKLVGLDIEWADILALFEKAGAPPLISRQVHRFPHLSVTHDGRQVGFASSITWSPYLEKMIGFGRLKNEFAKPGTSLFIEWEVEGEKGNVRANVVKLPFVTLKRTG